VATWRRSADSEVHVHIESAALARCGAKAHEQGERLDEPGQAICDDCAFAVLHDASDAEDCLAQLNIDRARAPAESLERLHKVALGALRALIGTVPSTGPTAGLLAEAERLLQLGDAGHAFDLVRQWRANMRTSGVLPSA
jgi:hypothetical protein